ncbi:MAG: hypothetical protein WCT08_04255 [Patescibacteria group bacterium]|jgi:hypothetical protein
MKKIISGIATGAILFLFCLPIPSSAYSPNWDVTGTYEWVVLGSYHHDVTITNQLSDGTFTGTAGYPAGSAPYNLPGQTTETITGYVDGNNISLTTTYAGPYNPGYTVTVSGTIDGTGHISGNVPWAWYMTGTATPDDHDGIYGDADKCPGTDADHLTESLGTNRYMWDGSRWITKTPRTMVTNTAWVTMEYTYGCSAIQILDIMKEKTGLDFGGHYKFGVSKSILEDWHRGTYHVGPTFVETVEVLASQATPTFSDNTLGLGKNYFLKAYGTAYACNQPGCVINFDADYSTSDGTNWVDGVAAPYDTYGTDLLDLKVDNGFVNWGAYNTLNTYQIPYAGTGNPLGLLIYDLPGSYFNDTGSLFVDIIEDLWVPLW